MVYRFSIFRPAQDSLEAFGSGCLLCVSESQFVSGIFKKVVFLREKGDEILPRPPALTIIRDCTPSKSKPAVGSVVPYYLPPAATPSHRAGVTYSTGVITFN